MNIVDVSIRIHISLSYALAHGRDMRPAVQSTLNALRLYPRILLQMERVGGSAHVNVAVCVRINVVVSGVWEVIY